MSMTAAKAFLASLIAGVGVVSAGMTDGHLTAAEGVAAALAGLIALGAVYGVTNKPA